MKKFYLQFFAEGGSGTAAGATAAAGSTGEATVDAAQNGRESQRVVYGRQDDTAEQDDTDGEADGAADDVSDETVQAERKSFDELIKGDYKKDFDERVHRIIGAKTANIKSLQEEIDKFGPILDLVSRKYGVDAKNIDALTNALMNDESYYEQEALEKGMSVEQLKQMRRIERENDTLRRTLERSRQENESARIYNEWMQQSEELKDIYPDFDFESEVRNEDFSSLLRNGIDVRTAYEVIHKDEIIQGAMAVTARKVKEKVTNDIRANGKRATENGMSSQAGTVFKSDVNSLTKADREEIDRRVARGEKISF